MSNIGTDPIFKGSTPGGISCEDFVQAVRKHAIVEKRTRDDEYIADFAMGCLTDDALHWSETLSREVQGDWSLLRPALLQEYGSSDRKVAYGVAIIPVPAAVPPPAQSKPSPLITAKYSQNIRGRIKVLAPSFTGYLSKQLDDSLSQFFRLACLTTPKVSDACVLSGTMGNGGLQFEFENLDPRFSELGTRLGIKWRGKDSVPIDERDGILRVVDINAPPQFLPISWLTWVCSLDNTLSPKLERRPGLLGARCDAKIVISSYTNGNYHIEIPPSGGNFSPSYGRQRARLVFESI